MEKLLKKKRITTIYFLGFIFIYGIVNAWKEVPILLESLQSDSWKEESASEKIDTVETTIDENLYGRYGFIDAYGYIQKVLGKNEESNFEVVKDTEGKLHYTYFTSEIVDTTEIAARVENFSTQIGEDTQLVYVMPPDKYIEGHTTYPTGIPYSMENETADAFLEHLDEYEISYLDLRDSLSESGIDLSDAFFATDHHWKIETAFWAATEFCDYLNENYGENLDPDGFYADIENYNVVTYEDIFLGSMGRKTGRYYAGADDFSLIYPMFETSYVMTNSYSDELVYTGRFEEALLATPVIRESDQPFDTDMYQTYLYGNPAFAHIENMEQEDGIKICMIKDSFAVPFAAFTSLRCQTVDLIDPRYFEGDYVETIQSGGYDYVIIMVSPQNIVDEFFPFGE